MRWPQNDFNWHYLSRYFCLLVASCCFGVRDSYCWCICCSYKIAIVKKAKIHFLNGFLTTTTYLNHVFSNHRKLYYSIFWSTWNPEQNRIDFFNLKFPIMNFNNDWNLSLSLSLSYIGFLSVYIFHFYCGPFSIKVCVSLVRNLKSLSFKFCFRSVFLLVFMYCAYSICNCFYLSFV